MGLRVNPGHSPHRLENGAVWIGPQIPGESTEISDEAGLVWPICRRLDGTRPREGLVAEVLAEQPPGANATAEDMREIIEFFSSIDLRPETTGYDLQARLKAARVAVLGLGGVGSAAAASLTGRGIGSLHRIDHDAVELSNLNRQLLYTETRHWPEQGRGGRGASALPQQRYRHYRYADPARRCR